MANNDKSSIRDYAEFREDLERLSEPGLSKKQAKIIRKAIYDTIDARVGNLAPAAAPAQGGLSDALPPGLVYAIERAISKAKTPGGQHTNGPTYASLEVSQLEFVLKHCIRGQVSDAADAARWRAVVASARIKPQGSAGLESPQPGNYAHMGLEMWTTHDRDYSASLLEQMDRQNALGRKWLTAYADVAVAAIQAQAGDAP